MSQQLMGTDLNAPCSIACGVDIVEIESIARSIKVGGERFLQRVYTPAELAFCRGRLPQLAARFAAKEAALKALQTGWSDGIAWQDIEVSAKESGAPVVLFHARARELYKKSGATQAHLSIAHTTEHAIAEVVLERVD